jgi:HEAT repeat protein
VKRTLLSLLLAVVAIGVAVAAPVQEPNAFRAEPSGVPLLGEWVDVYFSVGDNHFEGHTPPLSSPASIDTMFDVCREVFGARRIFWRGMQDAYLNTYGIVRPDNLLFAGYWRWLAHLGTEKKLHDHAVAAAHRRGMDIWAFTALFDFGAAPAEEAYNAMEFGPSVVEDRLRAEHPEWAPTDRHGIRRQSGPVELAYPAARRELVRRTAEHVLKYGYDGIMFYTYAEHTDLWFEDEFGFSEPIVEQFRRRYGQDIRTEPFDKQAWHRLRGEYVTAFLKELADALHPRGKKVGVILEPHFPYFPQAWSGMSREVPSIGRVHLNWERWVREGIVDEIMVGAGVDREKMWDVALAAVSNTTVVVSTLHPSPYPKHLERYAQTGLRRLNFGYYPDFEWGYKKAQPPEAITDPDPFVRVRVLRQIEEGKTRLPAERVAAATRDPNLLVRRQALRALAAQGGPTAVPFFEAALDDPEHAVRCVAVICLGQTQGTGSVERIFRALRAHANFQLGYEAGLALSKMGPERTADILRGTADQNVEVRRVVANSLERGATRPEAIPTMLGALRDDNDPMVRWAAIRALVRFGGKPGVLEAFLQAMNDKHPTVRAAAAWAIGATCRSMSPEIMPHFERAREALADRFLSFGGAYAGSDADWGYRTVGAALLELDADGRQVLNKALVQGEDPRLAEIAWRMLFLPHDRNAYHLVPESEALKAYQLHPSVRGKGRPTAN